MKIPSTSQPAAVEYTAARTETPAAAAGPASQAPVSTAETAAFREHQAGVAAQAKNIVLAEIEVVADGGAVTQPGKKLSAADSVKAFGEAMEVHRGGGSPTWTPAEAKAPIGSNMGYRTEPTTQFLKLEAGYLRETSTVDSYGKVSDKITRDAVEQLYGGALVHQHMNPDRSGSITVTRGSSDAPSSYRIDNLRSPADWKKAMADVESFEKAPRPAPAGI